MTEQTYTNQPHGCDRPVFWRLSRRWHVTLWRRAFKFSYVVTEMTSANLIDRQPTTPNE